MEAERYVDTGTAARLLGVHSNTVLNMIADGKLQAVSVEGNRGGNGGLRPMVAVASMPLEARLAYITQIDTLHTLPEGLLAAYREAYPKTGMQVLWHRHQVVMEAKADATFADYKQTTAAREKIAAKYNISTRTLYRWCKAYDSEGVAGLMDKIEQSNKGVPKALCLLAQDYAKDRMFGISRRTRAAAYDDASLKTVLLSPSRDNLGQRSLEELYDVPNTAIVGGQGEGVDRIVRTVNDSNVGLARNETFIDARDVNDATELLQRGTDKLAEESDPQVYTFNMDTTAIDDYFSGFFGPGDLCTVRDPEFLPGGDLEGRLAVAEEIYEDDVRRVEATIGYDKQKLAAVIAKIRKSTMPLLTT